MEISKVEFGELYLVATPIGNLEDITFRALRVLKEAHLIAAEDTRQTKKLLNFYEVTTPLISYHEHNKRQRGMELVEKLKEGIKIALVTDAGMPGISDPGEDLVKLAVLEGIRVIPIPGPTASLTALVASGLSTERFAFEGFLPRKKKDMKERLGKLVKEERTVIVYEAPHRLTKTLVELKNCLGNRNISISREITKKFEETLRGTIEEILAHFNQHQPKGEFVIVIEGATNEISPVDALSREEKLDSKIEIIKAVDDLIEEGKEKKEAFKEVAKIHKLSKRDVYNLYCRKL